MAGRWQCSGLLSRCWAGDWFPDRALYKKDPSQHGLLHFLFRIQQARPQAAHILPASLVGNGGAGIPRAASLQRQGLNKFNSGVQSHQALLAKTPEPHCLTKSLSATKVIFWSPLIPLAPLFSLSLEMGCVCERSYLSDTFKPQKNNHHSLLCRHLSMLFTQVIKFNPLLWGTIISTYILKQKLRHREVTQLAQGHPPRKGQKQNVNPSKSALELRPTLKTQHLAHILWVG